MHIVGILVLAAAARTSDGVEDVPAAACASQEAGFSCAATAAKAPADQVELMQKKMRVQSRAVDGEKNAVSTDSETRRTAELQDEANLVDKLVQSMEVLERTEAAQILLDQSDLSTTMESAQSNPPPEVAAMGDKLLFSIPHHAKIYQMNLDGTDVKAFAQSGMTCPGFGHTDTGKMATAMLGRPEFIAVDVDNNRMFWGDWLGGSGSGHGDPLTSGNETFPPPSYNASVLSSPLDSPEIDPVATSAFYRPPPGKKDGIPGCDENDDYACPPARLHVPTGKLPITHLDSPYAVAVDPVEKMVYWSDRKQVTKGTPKIMRASYDGHSTPPQDFNVAGMIGDIIALAIDHRPGQRKIYWIEYLNGHPPLYGSQIRRANLDGSGMEVLANGLARHPIGLALDLVNDAFLWTEWIGGRIRRCGLKKGCESWCTNCASRAELVLQAPGIPKTYSATSPKLGALALDPANDAMYWTEDHRSQFYGGLVKRAKLSGKGEVKELYRFAGQNELYKATPLGIAIVIASPRATTTAGPSGPCVAGVDDKEWKDGWGYGCKTWKDLKWCTKDGEAGTGYNWDWDPNGENMQGAKKNCCACGAAR